MINLQENQSILNTAEPRLTELPSAGDSVNRTDNELFFFFNWIFKALFFVKLTNRFCNLLINKKEALEQCY